MKSIPIHCSHVHDSPTIGFKGRGLSLGNVSINSYPFNFILCYFNYGYNRSLFHQKFVVSYVWFVQILGPRKLLLQLYIKEPSNSNISEPTLSCLKRFVVVFVIFVILNYIIIVSQDTKLRKKFLGNLINHKDFFYPK